MVCGVVTGSVHFLFLWRCFIIKNTSAKDNIINEDIKAELKCSDSKMFRVISNEGEQLGMLTFIDALEKAYEEDLDLVLMSAQSDPPVCKIMDYGKFRFDRDKREKEAKKKQQTIETKEIQLSCRIDVNDFNTKVNHAHRFLKSGNKVKVIVKFKGRQMTHLDIGKQLLEQFKEACSELGTVEKAPVLEGRFMSMMIVPAKATK
ncbi:MAG: translation initiation factor IF-3 [Clostridia bacterium]|nr:translation initiation factor IF-3 [Clostridia bacterium]